MAYLALAVILGTAMLSPLRSTSLALLQPVYFHLFMFGWVTQLIFGVAWWMFPPLSRDRPRGDPRLMWIAYALLNVGLVARAVSEPLEALHGGVWSAVLFASALLQTAAGLLLVGVLWPRVRAPGRQAAE